MVRGLHITIGLACILNVSVLADDINGSKENIEEFVRTIQPELAELQKASSAYADFRNGLLEDEEEVSILNDYEKARSKFEKTVSRNWPFPEAKTPGSGEAERAYKRALAFEEEMYQTGRVSRDAAVQKYIQVADSYAGSLAQHKALFMAANLYVQRLIGKAKPDHHKAEQLFQRLAAAEGPASAYVLWAEENVPSLKATPVERMEGRSEFYAELCERPDGDWLESHALFPTGDSTPSEYKRRVVGLLVQLQNVKYTNCRNMIADALMTPKPLQSLNWLMERHKGDSLAEAEIRSAIGYAMRSDFSYDTDKHFDDTIKELPTETLDAATSITKDGIDTVSHVDTLAQAKTEQHTSRRKIDKSVISTHILLASIVAIAVIAIVLFRLRKKKCSS